MLLHISQTIFVCTALDASETVLERALESLSGIFAGLFSRRVAGAGKTVQNVCTAWTVMLCALIPFRSDTHASHYISQRNESLTDAQQVRTRS